MVGSRDPGVSGKDRKGSVVCREVSPRAAGRRYLNHPWILGQILWGKWERGSRVSFSPFGQVQAIHLVETQTFWNGESVCINVLYHFYIHPQPKQTVASASLSDLEVLLLGSVTNEHNKPVMKIKIIAFIRETSLKCFFALKKI